MAQPNETAASNVELNVGQSESHKQQQQPPLPNGVQDDKRDLEYTKKPKKDTDKTAFFSFKENQNKNNATSNGLFSLKDINSRTNLIELDRASSDFDLNDKEEQIVVDNGKLTIVNDSFTPESANNIINNGNNNNQHLKPIANVTNNSSMSSMDTSIKFPIETDMLPLMRLNSDGKELIEPDEQKHPDRIDSHLEERWYVILAQVIFPFMIAGFGMVAAGVVLDVVQHWELFRAIKAIFTLIPALLGLKGNLEMTLASRFSTQVNIGRIKDRSTTMSAVLGNFALTQAQAIIVGFLASFGAILIKVIFKDTQEGNDMKNAFVLIAGSMSTASFASLILAGLMMFVIIMSKRFNINPDNVATPIAASLGDLVTLTILSYLCTFLYELKGTIWIHITIITTFFILVPVFMYYSYKNDFVKDALFNGWTPIILAMIISSTGGLIMGFAVDVYEDIAVFQPVVNGVGGNLVAIFASRLSTALHRTSTQGTQALWAPDRWYRYPFDTFFSKKNPESSTAIILAVIALPGHLLFYFTITRIKLYQTEHFNIATLTPSFVSFYTSVSCLQVLILLFICYWLVHFTWRLNQNPDNTCIPYLTAIGDLLGTGFLALCFHVLYLAGETRLRKN